MRPKVTIDGNEATAYIAYHASEFISIYPITPASPMGELADEWAAKGRPNVWGAVPTVVEMQSEAGAAGALHGGMQGGSLGTTFTASQGLLLMIPEMYKIAGELSPTVIHVAARTVATHALSIFADHSDVMACRATGFALLAANSVQETMDLALIAHAAALESRIPFLQFMDGFRTSHEIAKIEQLTLDDIRSLLDDGLVRENRLRALSPDRPVVRGTAQNPDVFFQAREAVNSYYENCPGIVQRLMDKFAALAGRQYRLFDYVGAPDADRVIVMMGSGAEAVEETVERLREAGEKVGLLKVRLYRPFSVEHFAKSLPATVKAIAVLDRTKEPGAAGEPLYLDVVTAVSELMTEAMPTGLAPFASVPRIVGGRYGLSSKEFTPAMAHAVFDELQTARPKNHFTVGIIDDVTRTHLDYEPGFSTEDPETVRAVFYGLGSDGTVGANKNSIKIIGEDTDFYAQGYFVYDSKKAGAMTVSHLRFGPRPIRSTYLIAQASFVACHQFSFLERMDVLKLAQPGATFLLNSPYGPSEVWDRLPVSVQREIVTKKLKLFVINADQVALATGMGKRINTIMQTCFFAISGVLPRDEAIAAIKRSIRKAYGKRGEAVVQKNFKAVDETLADLYEVSVPDHVTSGFDLRPAVPAVAPDFVQKVTARILAGEGDLLPVSAFPPDGTFPTGTSQWERRNIALEIPVWDPELCIQCGKCVMVCPHSVIRAKLYNPASLADPPPTFKSAPARWKEFETLLYSLQVAPEDCTGCSLCVQVCPVKSKSEVKHKAINMEPQAPLREPERLNWEYFLQLPDASGEQLNTGHVKDVQLLRPLFEFSGACAGCGETPYIKLVTQLFGDRTVIANATGCSSIYGGNLPTTPYSSNEHGRGPAWSNSLFEDNAEFGLGICLALDQQRDYARFLVGQLASQVGEELARSILDATNESAQSTKAAIAGQRERVALLTKKLANIQTPEARNLLSLADNLVSKSVWIVGGDGWAYDIGYGGLDHVLASGSNVNILVLDTEVYSNTGGQCSKATPRGAVAKFAFSGKQRQKKDLALMAMSYGSVYVARVAMGGSDTQTLKAFREAEAYPGTSLIIAFSPCIAHGYDLMYGMEQQKAAMREAPQWEKEGRERVKNLNHEVTQFAVGHLMDALRKKYSGLPEIRKHFDAIEQDVIENVDEFLKPPENFLAALVGVPQRHVPKGSPFFRRYEVNLLVDHSNNRGAPVVFEDNPTFQNLNGQVEYTAQFGALVTDFNLIRAGALHRANGGYLILEARKLLQHPYSWEGLKRALESAEIRIESLAEMLGVAATATLQPQRIPLRVKVVLLGERRLYYLLSQYDPEFSELFKVAADFEERMERTPESSLLYARLIGTLAKKENLLPLDRTAVARVMEQSARQVGDSQKLSTHSRALLDLLCEADYWARSSERPAVSADDVTRAIDAQIRRSDRVRERLQEEVVRETIRIETEQEKVGQVNGLSVIQLGQLAFGHPSRITARVRLGRGEVVDIEREVELGGPIHSKGVLILSSFLGARYASDCPLSLSASLVFEQSYGGVEGDSASSAEPYALLSALAEAPIRQWFAVTGSVDQQGQVQAIGGVNEKIEGFFDLCQARGLTGKHGALIPAANVKHLMLRRDVVEAVEEGKFHVYAVETIDQGIEVLTGMPAGERDSSGRFPDGTVNQRVEARLSELAEKRRLFGQPGQSDQSGESKTS